MFDPAKKARRRLTDADRKRIVYSFYGSITDFRRQVRSTAQVAKELTFHQSTVQNVIRIFRAKGYNFEAMMSPKKPFLMLSPRLKRLLLSARLLQEWAPFGVRERALMIERLWQVRITFPVLQRFYAANKVDYKRNKEVFVKALKNRRELDEERKGFAIFLGNLLAAKKSLIYVDETTFISGTCKKKSW